MSYPQTALTFLTTVSITLADVDAVLEGAPSAVISMSSGGDGSLRVAASAETDGAVTFDVDDIETVIALLKGAVQVREQLRGGKTATA